MKALVTGSAGFIGFNLARHLLEQGHTVLGVDALTTYYDPQLKLSRMRVLTKHSQYEHVRGRIEDDELVSDCTAEFEPDVVVHLAAQAGVRYSIERPDSYLGPNIIGTFNILEAVRRTPVKHLLMASTSSIYGSNATPFAERQRTDHPLSLYAATKKAAEDIGHSYAYLYRVPTTCFRFFTVYGPWGRPDMALFKFVKAAFEGLPVDVYGHGSMSRDFTYIDDLVEQICLLIDRVPDPDGEPVAFDSLSPVAPFRTVNVGGGAPVALLDFLDSIERATGRKIERRYLAVQPGEVVDTNADSSLLQSLTGTAPSTPIDIGVQRFVDWYREYYHIDR